MQTMKQFRSKLSTIRNNNKRVKDQIAECIVFALNQAAQQILDPENKALCPNFTPLAEIRTVVGECRFRLADFDAYTQALVPVRYTKNKVDGGVVHGAKMDKSESAKYADADTIREATGRFWEVEADDSVKEKVDPADRLRKQMATAIKQGVTVDQVFDILRDLTGTEYNMTSVEEEIAEEIRKEAA